MTSPAPLSGQDPLRRANWLGRYLAVERKFDDKLKGVLLDALSGIDDAFTNLGDKFSDNIRKTQLSQSNRALRGVIKSLYGETGNLIRDYRSDAAVAAVDAGIYDQRSILSRLFPNSTDRQAYADSLRQTGRRNIESVITRVLETEKPLSTRVYKSQALANGLVSTTINRALARGDSAANLARDVKALIDPNVPGGVSYAARRLGRTELNNAFHAQSIHDAQESPWIQQMEWHLSKVHELQRCKCELYAIERFFGINSVPEKPHPNCRCFVTPVLPEYQNFENALVSGQYDSYLDSVLGFDNEQPARTRSTSTKAEKPSPAFTFKGIEAHPEFPMRADIKAAKTHTEVTKVLNAKYPHLKFAGWSKTNVSLDGAKELAVAIDDNMMNLPGNGLVHIAFQKSEKSPGALAVTRRNDDGTSSILMNPDFTKGDSGKLAESVRKGVETQHLRAWDAERPMYSTFTHEFGHVIDNDGHKMAMQGAPAQVVEAYNSVEPEPNTPREVAAWDRRAKAWLVGTSRDPFNGHAPSGYSVMDTTSGLAIDPGEIVAESYLDVMMNHERAQPSSRQVDALLFHYFKKFNLEKFEKGW